MMHVIVSSKPSSDTPACPGPSLLVAEIDGIKRTTLDSVTSRSAGLVFTWPDRPSAARRASRRDSTVGRGETCSGGEAIFRKVDHSYRLVLTEHTFFSTTHAGTESYKKKRTNDSVQFGLSVVRTEKSSRLTVCEDVRVASTHCIALHRIARIARRTHRIYY
jgi:hypothetical protein